VTERRGDGVPCGFLVVVDELELADEGLLDAEDGVRVEVGTALDEKMWVVTVRRPGAETSKWMCAGRNW